MALIIFFFLLFLPLSRAHFNQPPIVDTSYLPPRPIITLHSGHIGLYDQLLIMDYTGTIQPGEPYTLDIYMGNTDRFDYVIDRCVYNDKISFLDNYGCLRRDDIFLQKWETNEYTLPGALKRTLVHFIASEPIVQFRCDLKVIECCGCAEESCERQPQISYFPVYDMPIFCSYPTNPNNIIPQRPGGYGGPPWYNRNDGFWSGIPWWLWLLLLLLLLLLLALLVCAVCCCLARKRNSGSKQKMTTVKQVYPESKPPPAAPPIPVKPLVIDTTVQTAPETRPAGQQVDMDKKNKKEEKFETNHSYQKHRRSKSNTYRQQETASAHDGISLVDGPFYTENSGTIVRTIYEEGRGEYPGYLKEKKKQYNENYVNLDSSDRYRQYNAVPVHRAPTLQHQEQFQSEIAERLRREQERQELQERIENHLSEHKQHRERRYYEASPSGETLREETYRTMRQSSVI